MMQLTLKTASWDLAAQNALAAAVPNCSVLDLKAQIDDDGAQLFTVSNDQKIVAYYVLRIDQLIEHSEGVIIAAAGMCEGVDLTAEVLPVIEKQFIGCKYIRIHTARPGLVKKLTNSGYNPLEFVMIKWLDNGQ
jgi:hypothetical protein